MKPRFIIVTFFVLILGLAPLTDVSGQQGERIDYEAESLEGGQRGEEKYIKLTTQVKFTQTKTIIHCDSAFLFRESNELEAYGHVKIEDLEDSVIITSNRLYYSGDDKMAHLRGNVVYRDDSIQLLTEFLDYDMTNKSANYFNGGQIIDGVNELTSEEGLYDTEGKLMIFQKNVFLKNPDYTLEADELIYNIITKRARTTSYTLITMSDGRALIAKEGSEFDTSQNTSAFLVGEINTDAYQIKADELFYNQNKQYYSAKGNVFVFAKRDNVIITGEEAVFSEVNGKTKVFGNAILQKPMKMDTLYLAADTLVSIDSQIEAEKRMLAYNNVLIFKTDFQGRADSLSYHVKDSLIYFYTDPILWNEGTQISADSIEVLIAEGAIDQMNTSVNSFIISLDSMENYNQIKGREMNAFFKGNEIDHVDVTGNGESIYFALDEEHPGAIVGMNKILCSNMKINFLENTVHTIAFYKNPDASFIPPHELKESEKLLKGFQWRIKEKPELSVILNSKVNEVEEKAPEPVLTQPIKSPEEEEILRNKLKQAQDKKIIENTLKTDN